MLIQIDENQWAVKEADGVLDKWQEFDEIVQICHDSDPYESIRHLQAFIQTCPDHIDAIHHLALQHFELGNLLEAILLEKSAVEIVIENDSSQLDLSEVQLSWEVLENRPFLRALHSLGVFQFCYGKYNEAENTLNLLLSLNKSDNLGGRYNLVKLAFETNNPEMVLSLASKFPNDGLPELLFGKVLAHIQLKQTDLAEVELTEAASLYPKIVDVLTRNLVEAEDISSGLITMGGQDQAFTYRQDYLEYWYSTDGAIPFLKEIIACN